MGNNTEVKSTTDSQHEVKLNVMGSYLTDDEAGKIVECCECGHKHRKGDRVEQKQTEHMNGYLCPQCGQESYYNCP